MAVSKLTDALNRIYQWLEINIPEFAQAFHSGLSYEEIESQLSGISLHLPEEIYDLYQWKNGVAIDLCSITNIYSSGDFSQLSQSLENYENLIEQDLICDNPMILDLIEVYSKESLFPFFRDDNGYTYAVIATSQKKLSSPVIFITGDCSFSLKYQSLTAMFLTIAECYETGAYYIETEGDYQGEISEDSKKVSLILKKHNPELIERALLNITSLINGDKDHLDDYDYGEYLDSNFGQLRRFRELGALELLLDTLNRLNSGLRTKRSESLISEIIYTLGYMDNPEVIPYILSALNEQSEIIRYYAERAAIEQGIEIK